MPALDGFYHLHAGLESRLSRGVEDLAIIWVPVPPSKAVDKFKILGVLFEIIFWGCHWDIFGSAIQKMNSYFY